jgi:hypothetical protein
VKIVRQRIEGGIARQRRIDSRQLQLDLQPTVFPAGERLYEYTVLVTDVPYPIEVRRSCTLTAPMPRAPSTS